MKTKAIRLHGKNDLRMDAFELPPMKKDEILVKIITDSVCMSTYKLCQQGEQHKRAQKDLSAHPVVIGHEMSGVIIKVGEYWKDRYKEGTRFTVQPDMTYQGKTMTPGYYYENFGGDSTYSILPKEVMELDCLIPFDGDSFFEASLSEPAACIAAGYHRMYHTSKENHNHVMGVKKGGYQIIFGACGPMGLECIDYGLQIEDGAGTIVAVDVTKDRLERAKKVLTPRNTFGKKLMFVNANDTKDLVGDLLKITDGHGFDDAFVYAPVESLIEEADHVLAEDGCLNFFAGPIDKNLSARVNFYNVHYSRTHTVGFTGSTKDDLRGTLHLMEDGVIRPTVMVTHIGGLESAIHATLNLPEIPGGKKMIYTQIDLPLTAIEDFRKLGEENELFRKLADACDAGQGCWNAEAEKILLEHFRVDLTK